MFLRNYIPNYLAVPPKFVAPISVFGVGTAVLSYPGQKRLYPLFGAFGRRGRKGAPQAASFSQMCYFFSLTMSASDSNNSKLTGKVALVTGAGKRLGRAIAVHLAREGADVVVHFHHSAPEGQQVVTQIISLGRRAISLRADLAKKSDIDKLFADTNKEFGRLDILVNNASNFLHADFPSITEKIWDAALDVNLKAPFFCSQAAAPLLKKNNGVIINLSDIAGFLGWTGYIPHSVSKAGVTMLTRVLAKALAPEIRVNAIAPGTITMPGDPPDLAADFIKRAPLQRTGTTEDVTAAISFLINSPFITGEVLLLDGGRTL
jgi:pteridine reductase